MVTELQNIFPGMPDAVAARSLQATQSVQKTTQLVLDGKLTWPDRTNAAAKVDVENSYMNNAGQKKSTYAMEGYVEKKQQMLEKSRRLFLERKKRGENVA